jgi:hypothetical protein
MNIDYFLTMFRIYIFDTVLRFDIDIKQKLMGLLFEWFSYDRIWFSDWTR